MGRSINSICQKEPTKCTLPHLLHTFGYKTVSNTQPALRVFNVPRGHIWAIGCEYASHPTTHMPLRGTLNALPQAQGHAEEETTCTWIDGR